MTDAWPDTSELDLSEQERAAVDALIARLSAPCSMYTARRWSPHAAQPEDGRCVNCGQAHDPASPLPPDTTEEG